MAFDTDRSAISGYLLCLATSKPYKLPLSNTMVKWTIGSDSRNNLVLQKPEISRRHCFFIYKSGQGYVFVNTSSKGSQINGKPARSGKKYTVQHGDLISLGGVAKFHFYQVEPDIWNIYDCANELGRGTFGSVHKCFEKTSGRCYAVKVIDRQRFPLVLGAEKMFKQDIKILKTLNSKHEHIVQLEEIFERRSMLYLVLEYVNGGDLAGYLRVRPPLAEEETRGFVLQICSAVAFIHDQGVAHRDLKPENILLTDDRPPKVKVADFGLAKLTSADAALKTQCGTPNYVAPEVGMYSPSGYSKKVDSWSIGVITFRMLTKQLPFHWPENLTKEQNLWNYLSQRVMDLKPLYQLKCSQQCVHFVEGLLKIDPDERLDILLAHENCWLDGVDNSALPFEQALATLPHVPGCPKTNGSLSIEAVNGSMRNSAPLDTGSLRGSPRRSGRTSVNPMVPGGFHSSWLRSGTKRENL